MTQPTLSRGAFLKLMSAAGLAAAMLGMPEATAAKPSMRTKPIPKSGEALPVIGLGTWLGFDVGGSEDERTPLRNVLKNLFAGGGTVIDSSPMYGNAEAVAGDLLKDIHTHSKSFLATKVWTSGKQGGVEQMAQSFRYMRTDVMDLMQIHNLLDWTTHLKTLRQMKEAGKIRYIGITHYTSSALDELAAVIESEPIDFVQMAYSIGVRDAEDRLLPVAAKKGVAVLVNRPYEGGDLFGPVRGKKLPPWAEEFDCTSWGQFFLKFILSHPAVSCVIPGTSKPHHMLDNLGAGYGRLPDQAQRAKMLTLFKDL